MKEYQKINNIFKFDEKYRTIVGMADTYQALRNIEWIGTEKVDGTNIRIYWDGHEIQIAGRTEKSQIPNHLMNYLSNLFLTQEMEYVFEQMFGEKETYLFGEGYGFKIQTNGDKYFEDRKNVGFILFDVNINGFDLSRDNVNDIAEKLGLKSVPVVFKGNLNEAIEFVKKHPMSTLGDNSHEMEGLVLQPIIQLYDSKHNLIKCKCKYVDVIKLNDSI